MGAPEVEISGELRAAWNRRLYEWWHYYNHTYTGGSLRVPCIELGRGASLLGRWERESRRLVISLRHIERDPWVAVLATLRHEMAHQYAHEVLRAQDEPPHGAAFDRACYRLRCHDGSNAECPMPGPCEAQVLSRIKKVMSLAGSANEHEAETAVKQARRLLLRHNIDVAGLGGHREFGHRHVGPVKARHASYELWLAQILHEFFFTEVIWVESYNAIEDKVGTVLRLCGTRQNLDLAEHAYTYLWQLLERLWQTYRRKRALPGNRERQRYYAGVLEGFCIKLRRQEQRIQTQEALVWKGDGQLMEYHRYLHPYVRTRRGGGVAATEAYRDGLEEGRNVTIHRPLGRSHGGFGGYLTGA